MMWYTEDLIPISLDDVKDAATNCGADRIFLHWSAGRYGQAYEDYHINIDADGSLYCIGELNFNKRKNHTYRRNSGSIGISLCCAYGAVANDGYNADYGDYPPTAEQIEAMAMVIAIICKYAGIDINDNNSCLTHKEIACQDGYGVPVGSYVDGIYQGDSDCRWDLWYLKDYDGKMIEGGDLLRGKARWYYDKV